MSAAVTRAQVAVHHPEGIIHGFLALRTLDGRTIADGDLLQDAAGSQVTSRLVFHFRDGSLYDDTAVFTESRAFRLISDHMIQKGPSFPQPIEMFVDGVTGRTTVHYTNDHGEAKTETKTFKVPPDLANGLVPTLMKNVRPSAPPKKLSLIVATPAPRMVTLEISTAADDTFTFGGTSRRATHYVMKVGLGGVVGVIAPIIGKQPPDSHVWISTGDAPAFVKAEQQFFADGPVWRIELVSPVWK